MSRTATPSKTGSRSATPTKVGGTPTAKKDAGAPNKATAGGAGLKKRPPTGPPKAGEFVAAKKFDGPRTGMVFKNGPHGTGYYSDAKGGHKGASASPSSSVPASASSSERELDAAEVFQLLPLAMQVAFEARDINALDAALSALPPAEAELCMQRCIKSGLWDPNGGGGGEAAVEQEPSPTGESDELPRSEESSPSASDTVDAADAPLDVTDDASAGGGEAAEAAAPTTQLFERGPYKAGGAASDAPKRGSAATAKAAKAAASEAEKEAAPAPAKKGGKPPTAHASSSKAPAARGSGVQQELEAAQQSVKMEQQGRMAAEAELGRAQTQVQRLLTKLDEAERFKSDEARAMSAARVTQKRLQDENDKLRRLLAEAGTSEEAISAALGAPSAASDDAEAASSNPPSAFDAPKEDPETISDLGFPPASLDPDVVLQSLPKTMQDAFDALDVAALHAALAALPPAEASEYMRRCVASGLWDPNGAGGGADGS